MKKRLLFGLPKGRLTPRIHSGTVNDMNTTTAPPTLIPPARIKATRLRLGLTQREFATRLGLGTAKSTVSSLEMGRRTPSGPLNELLLREERFSLETAPGKFQNNSAQASESS